VRNIWEIFNSSSGVVSDAEPRYETLPETAPALMSAVREMAVLDVLLSSRDPKFVRTASLSVMWLVNGLVRANPHRHVAVGPDRIEDTCRSRRAGNSNST
jgi:hypothetical protein